MDGFAPNLAQPLGVADVITSNTFFGDWSRGVDSVGTGGSKIALSH